MVVSVKVKKFLSVTAASSRIDHLYVEKKNHCRLWWLANVLSLLSAGIEIIINFRNNIYTISTSSTCHYFSFLLMTRGFFWAVYFALTEVYNSTWPRVHTSLDIDTEIYLVFNGMISPAFLWLSLSFIHRSHGFHPIVYLNEVRYLLVDSLLKRLQGWNEGISSFPVQNRQITCPHPIIPWSFSNYLSIWCIGTKSWYR